LAYGTPAVNTASPLAKGSSVKRSAEQWRLRFSDHIAFFSYRWLALFVAALALILPGRPDAAPTGEAGLLLLAGVFTVIATALAQSYVRLLRQRPALLALDLCACAALLWLSGSQPLPLLPYALGALLLPALLFGWRGALLAAAAFAALDLFGLALLNPAVGDALHATSLAARVAVPFAFAGAWAMIGRAVQRRSGTLAVYQSSNAAPRTLATSPGERAWYDQDDQLGGPDQPRPDLPPNLSAPTSLLMTRTAGEPHAAPSRRVLYDLPPSPDPTLAAALDQLAAAGRQSGLDVRATSSGAARPLNPAQQTLLLRTAQEALHNVRQHAHAHSALITLSFEAQAVTLVVQDDGVGLLDGTYERPGLHALRAVRYRLAELDGQLAVFESESGGVTVRATLPLE